MERAPRLSRARLRLTADSTDPAAVAVAGRTPVPDDSGVYVVSRPPGAGCPSHPRDDGSAALGDDDYNAIDATKFTADRPLQVSPTPREIDAGATLACGYLVRNLGSTDGIGAWRLQVIATANTTASAVDDSATQDTTADDNPGFGNSPSTDSGQAGETAALVVYVLLLLAMLGALALAAWMARRRSGKRRPRPRQSDGGAQRQPAAPTPSAAPAAFTPSVYVPATPATPATPGERVAIPTAPALGLPDPPDDPPDTPDDPASSVEAPDPPSEEQQLLATLDRAALPLGNAVERQLLAHYGLDWLATVNARLSAEQRSPIRPGAIIRDPRAALRLIGYDEALEASFGPARGAARYLYAIASAIHHNDTVPAAELAGARNACERLVRAAAQTSAR